MAEFGAEKWLDLVQEREEGGSLVEGSRVKMRKAPQD